MPDIVISEFMDEAPIADLAARHSVIYQPDLVDRPSDLLALLADAKALIVRNRTQVRGALLDAAPGLRAVGRLGVGLDNIDLDACKARGIAVLPATGANDDGVAEYVIGAAMTLLRGAFHAKDEMIAGAWPRTRLMGREIAGKRLGLIGYGAIARKTAARARALGMSIAAFDPYLPEADGAWAGALRCATLAEMLPATDVVSLHVPLTEATRNILDAAAMALMQPGAIVINAARGGVLDEAALVTALKAGRLGGAALDVFATEPMTAASGALFANTPNLIVTPHIAGVSVESNVRVSAVTAANVLAALETSR
jgi:(S)-sulfolactate dehydrogenase